MKITKSKFSINWTKLLVILWAIIFFAVTSGCSGETSPPSSTDAIDLSFYEQFFYYNDENKTGNVTKKKYDFYCDGIQQLEFIDNNESNFTTVVAKPGYLKSSWQNGLGNTYDICIDNEIGKDVYVAQKISGSVLTYAYNEEIWKLMDAKVKLRVCDGIGICKVAVTTPKSEHYFHDLMYYFKASNAGEEDYFGWSVAISNDAKTLVVGAIGEASNSLGLSNADQTDNSAKNAGAVYVYSKDEDDNWTNIPTYLKASNTQADDQFGHSLAISADGKTLAIGAIGEDSNATGTKAAATAQNNNSAENAGAVYVYTKNVDGEWNLTPTYIKSSNTESNQYFGFRVELSSDGRTMAVSAKGKEDSNVTVKPQVYVYEKNQTTGNWEEPPTIFKLSNDQSGFGVSLSLSDDGKTLAVGANLEDSNFTNSGAVYVFRKDENGIWNTNGILIKSSNPDEDDLFGTSLSLSESGSILAVGAPQEDGNSTYDEIVLETNSSNNEVTNSGAVYVYEKNENGEWNTTHPAYIKVHPSNFNSRKGNLVKLSADGNTLAVGSDYYKLPPTIEGLYNMLNIPRAGGNNIDLLSRVSKGKWQYIDFINGMLLLDEGSIELEFKYGYDIFGASFDLNVDGSTLVIGVVGEDSNSTGINGNQKNNEVQNSGAAYLY